MQNIAILFTVFNCDLFNRGTVALNKEEDDEIGKKTAAETSSEILEDVLRQLDKLGSEKRKHILNKLAVSNVIADSDDKNLDKIRSTTPRVTSAKQSRETESIQDEVEILDLHEPKLGTYKRKRSKFTSNTLRILN